MVILVGLPDISLGIEPDRRHQYDLWRRFDDWSGPGCARGTVAVAVSSVNAAGVDAFVLGIVGGPLENRGWVAGDDRNYDPNQARSFPTRSKKGECLFASGRKCSTHQLRRPSTVPPSWRSLTCSDSFM